jgi:hypothetical protein
MASHSTRVRVASHVKLRLAGKRPYDEVPVGQVFGVVDLDSWIPFKCRGRDIVIITNTDDGRVRVETRQDRIPHERHVEISCAQLKKWEGVAPIHGSRIYRDAVSEEVVTCSINKSFHLA